MSDVMFEPGNWRSFKSFVMRVRDRAESRNATNADWISLSMEGDAGPSQTGGKQRVRPVFA